MDSILDQLKQFYLEHQQTLKRNYPGLRLKYFQEQMAQALEVTNDASNLKLEELLSKSLDGVPLEYMAKQKFFYRSTFYVDERVLIPRSETEILVEDAIDFLRDGTNCRLAEIGVGSGSIAISIAKEVEGLFIYAGDISSAALAVAKKNIETYQKEFAPNTHLELLHSDRLEGFQGSFDMVVCNPPYIKFSDEVHPMVKLHEPLEALFLDDHAYEDWFEVLFKQVGDHLAENGIFLMEGHEDHLPQLKSLAAKYFKDIELKKDYTQRTRFLYAKI